MNINAILAIGLTATFKGELARIESGERQWNIGNQFDDNILENAIEKLKNPDNAAVIMQAQQGHSGDEFEMSIMQQALLISDFEVPGLSAAWTN